MKQTLTTSEVADALRADENADWSYEGAQVLAEYLESLEEDCGEEMEFDRVAIRCDFSEYASAEEACDAYGIEYEEGEAFEELESNTIVLVFDGGVIIQNF
jgi:hypothetical protein